MTSRRRLTALVVAACLAAGGALVALSSGESSGAHTRGLVDAATAVAPSADGTAGQRPNIVFVLTDDLSMNLLRFMPHVEAMAQHGLTFSNYFVSDSLCCPSRSSIFTGDFPHDTGVWGNFGRTGGFHAFLARGEQHRTFAVALQHAGYQTAMMGKFLNGYLEAPGQSRDGAVSRLPATYVPPGWSNWEVAGWGYPEYNYLLNANHSLELFGGQASDYLTDVLARKGVGFVDAAAHSGKPFFLELATFAPHSPYVPAPRNAHDFPGLQAPRGPNFDVIPTHAPQWLSAHRPLRARQITRIDSAFRRRAQSVESVDQMIGAIEAALRADGVAQNTYVVFSSDNGLHTGEYRLMPGKLTAFDTDIHVPLIVTGPGVPEGATVDQMAENVDLAKTFAGLAGARLPSDGHSLEPLLTGAAPSSWRDAVLVEHRGSHLSVLDPDFQQSASGSPTTYEAMRTSAFLYVEYADGEREFYDLRTDPFELHNLAGRLTRAGRRRLHAALQAMEVCHGGRSCWAAMHVNETATPLVRSGP